MPVTFTDDPIVVDLRAEAISKAAAQSISDACRKRIPQGMLSDGSGSQAPEKRLFRMPEVQQDGIRGHENGRIFAKRIKPTRIKGGKAKAEYMATLQLKPGKIADRVYAWLERELGEGVEYIHVPKPGSPGDKEMGAAIQAVLDEAIK